MRIHTKSGFVLPLVLLLMGSLLMVTTLLLKMARFDLEQSHLQARALRAETLLKLNAKGLQKELEARLSASDGASALVVPKKDLKMTRSLWVNKEGAAAPLHSVHAFQEGTAFVSANKKRILYAEWVPMNNTTQLDQFSLAWAFEDLALSNQETPPFWPFPQLNIRPAPLEGNSHSILMDKVPDIKDPFLWVPLAEALPFTPEAAPAMTPVLRNLGLRFSIFASGPVRSREKIIRIRYFIEGTIWNPYNRAMRLHDGSATRPTFRVQFTNLPRVRIHNLSRGRRSGWMDLNTARNDQSSARGIGAWVELPAILEAGMERSWTAPRLEQQEEGLARTLHQGFLVGPADRIRLEFEPGKSVGFTALPLNEENAETISLAWADLQGSFHDWPDLLFQRADAGERPFYLSGGSLSFRTEKAQALFVLETELIREQPKTDPRWQMPFPENLANQRTAEFLDLTTEARDIPEPSLPVSIFSWPGTAPESLLAISDLPWIPNGFQLGRPDCPANELLESVHPWPLTQDKAMEAPSFTDWTVFEPCLPVNSVDPEQWKEAILASAVQSDDGWKFPVFPTVNPDTPSDHFLFNEEEIDRASFVIADQNASQPLPSIVSFFNSNRPMVGFGNSASRIPHHLNLPFRALFRNSPPLAPHSGAWLLHIAIRGKDESVITYRSARYWLLQVIDSKTGQAGLHLIQKEATDPDRHLRHPSQSPAAPTNPARESEHQPR